MPGAEHVAVVDGPVLADAIKVAAAAEAPLLSGCRTTG
jgi:hypothetical protein